MRPLKYLVMSLRFDKWYDYTPVGMLANATGLMGALEKPIQGVSDTLFGTTYGQERLQQQQQVYNAEEAQKNRDWQKYMVDYENAYNNPSAMMQRFRDAGINPAFMMSGSAPDISSASPSGGSAASSALGSAPHGSISLSDALLAAQVDNINADTEKKKAETKASEISNKVDAMNAEAFEDYYVRNKDRIVNLMSRELGLKENEIGLSNYELFEAAWNFSIQFGTTLTDAIEIGKFNNLNMSNLSALFPEVMSQGRSSMSSRYNQAKTLYIGGVDAEIAANAAARVVSTFEEQKNRKNVDFYSYLNDKAANGSKWEKIGAYVALAALFISEQNFNIPMPNVRINTFKRNSNTSISSNDTYNQNFNKFYGGRR